MRLEATIAYNADGDSTCRLVLSNIAERKQAEEALQREHVMLERTERIAQIGSWKQSAPDTVGDFSAVGYFFGANLRKSLSVPVGLIQSAYPSVWA